MFKNLNTPGANSFDPDNYDATMTNRYNGANGSDAGSYTQSARPGEKMQINLTLANPTATNLTFELFSYLDSFLRRLKSEYATGAFLYVPLSSFEGITRHAADTGGTVGFDQDGSCRILGANFAAAAGKISCAEIAYASFFEASGISPFEVAFIRFTCSTDAQIDNNITYFQKTYSGGIKENTISPRAYFRPNQFQNKTIDITVAFTIGIDKGLRTLVNAGESVRLALFIQMWTNQSL